MGLVKSIFENYWFMFVISLVPTITFGLMSVVFLFQLIDNWGWNFPNPEIYLYSAIFFGFIFAFFSLVSAFFFCLASGVGRINVDIKVEKDVKNAL